MRTILVPLGTRPEIIKLAPVLRALTSAGFDVRTVATGQHYDASLTDVFFAALGISVDEHWDPVDGDEGERVGAIVARAYREMAAHRPDLVLVLGDTYTVPLFCLAARRHSVPVAHLEAGLRSRNPTSMEEVNRHVAAATAALHLAPTELAARFLEAEGVDHERIAVVGNPVIDVLRERGIEPAPLDERAGVVVTAHRSSNVDDDARLAALVRLVHALAARVGPVTFPLHPRTERRLVETGLRDDLERPGVSVCPPVGYDEMITLISRARVVVTDSGGLQEEAAYFGVPTVVLRRSTPRWEGIEAGIAVLTGMDADRAAAEAVRLTQADEQARIAAQPCPYGDGNTGKRVAELLADPRIDALLTIAEPDFVDRPPPAP